MRQATVGHSAQDDHSEINLTPMLDVVFIMLIFFLVVASFLKEVGLEVNQPGGSMRPAENAENILITIAEDNGIWIEGRLIDARAVRANIARQHAENPDSRVIIQAHKRSANNTFVQVMDASRQVGVYDVSLAAEQNEVEATSLE